MSEDRGTIKLAGCEISASCPSIVLDHTCVLVIGVLDTDPETEVTVVITKKLFDQAVAKFAELEASTDDGETR